MSTYRTHRPRLGHRVLGLEGPRLVRRHQPGGRLRLPAAGRPDRAGCGRHHRRLALLPAPGPRLPLVHHRHDRRRRPGIAECSRRPRPPSCAGRDTLVHPGLRCRVHRLRRTLRLPQHPAARPPGDRHPGARRAHDPARPDVHGRTGAHTAAIAHVQAALHPARRTRRGPAARRDVWHRLDPVHRPHPRRRALAVDDHRFHAAAAPSSPSSTRSASASPSCSSPSPSASPCAPSPSPAATPAPCCGWAGSCSWPSASRRSPVCGTCSSSRCRPGSRGTNFRCDACGCPAAMRAAPRGAARLGSLQGAARLPGRPVDTAPAGSGGLGVVVPYNTARRGGRGSTSRLPCRRVRARAGAKEERQGAPARARGLWDYLSALPACHSAQSTFQSP